MDTNLAQRLDLANHHASATQLDIETMCKLVLEYGFNAAFVNPHYVLLAKELLGGDAKVGCAIAFPLGQESRNTKIASAKEAAAAGADELDVVANLGLLLEGNNEEYLAELTSIVTAVKGIDKNKIVKFILETGYMTETHIKIGAQLILESGADFVKICSGMGPRGASVADVKLVREEVGDKIRVKVAGGISSYEQAKALFDAGADRIGTSHAVEILRGAQPTPTSGASE